MSDPFVTWYATNVDPVDVVTSMAEVGLTSRWPLHPDVVSVLDLEGDTVPTTPADFEQLVRSLEQDSATFQLWFSDSEDVVVTYFRAREMTGPLAKLRVTLYLDGAPRSQAVAVAGAMERLVVDHASATVALVADLDGRTEEFDWAQGIADPESAPVVDSLILDMGLLGDGRGGIRAGWLPDTPTEGLATRRW